MNDIGAEVRELRIELSSLRRLLSPNRAAPVSTKLRVHIERSFGERKPYLLILRSEKEYRLRISATRAAILLPLLVDLDQRSLGLYGISNIRDVAFDIIKQIAPDLGNSFKIQEQIRLGLYRFGKFWTEEFDQSFPVRFDTVSERLIPATQATKVGVELTTTDSECADILSKLSGRSMLERVRSERFLFVPSGGSGGEIFLKEIYGIESKLTVTGTYFRPQIISLPLNVLKRFARSKEAIDRHKLMHSRLAAGTLSFTEIVPEESLTTLATPDENGHYPYFPGFQIRDVEQHFDSLTKLVQGKSGYRLLLTRAEIPFHVGVYRTSEFELADFFRLPNVRETWDFSSFAVWGRDVAATISATVLDWLTSHPSTTSDPASVLKILESSKEKLAKHRTLRR